MQTGNAGAAAEYKFRAVLPAGDEMGRVGVTSRGFFGIDGNGKVLASTDLANFEIVSPGGFALVTGLGSIDATDLAFQSGMWKWGLGYASPNHHTILSIDSVNLGFEDRKRGLEGHGPTFSLKSDQRLGEKLELEAALSAAIVHGLANDENEQAGSGRHLSGSLAAVYYADSGFYIRPELRVEDLAYKTVKKDGSSESAEQVKDRAFVGMVSAGVAAH